MKEQMSLIGKKLFGPLYSPGEVFKRYADSGTAFKRLTPGFKRLASNNYIVSAPETVAGDAALYKSEYRVAYIGLCILTMLLYARIHEVYPGIFGGLPLIKLMAIFTPFAYIVTKMGDGQKLMEWPRELILMLAIYLIAVVLTPFAYSRQQSIYVLTDPLFKAIIFFILLINLIDTRKRLKLMLEIMVLCSLFFALGAIKSYLKGEQVYGNRIGGMGNGLFGNPNDLATLFVVVVPFAVIFALTGKKWKRIFYCGATGIFFIAVMVTFSRGGFLGLIAITTALVLKLGFGRRIKTMVAATAVMMVMMVAMPAGYGRRISTIFNTEKDTTGSAQERKMILDRAIEVAVHNAALGVGAGNFHIYSIQEKAAHNSYLEVAAELGLVGLLAYLGVIFAPMLSLLRIESGTRKGSRAPDYEVNILSIGIQASLIAYIVCSFFASVQYYYFLYYSVGYAVALRRIRSTELSTMKSANIETETPGMLMRVNRDRDSKGELWSWVEKKKGILMKKAGK